VEDMSGLGTKFTSLVEHKIGFKLPELVLGLFDFSCQLLVRSREMAIASLESFDLLLPTHPLLQSLILLQKAGIFRLKGFGCFGYSIFLSSGHSCKTFVLSSHEL